MKFLFNRKDLFRETEYPVRYNSKNLPKTAIVLFVVVLAFLSLYKPFGVYVPEQKFNYFFICCLHALSPSLIVYMYFGLLNYYRSKRPNPHEWNLFQEFLQIFIVLFFIGIASFLMRDFIYNNPDNWSLRYLLEEVSNCYLAGSLFYFYLMFANFYFRSKFAADILEDPDLKATQLDNATTAASVIFISTLVKQDNFSFNPIHLLFAKAEGNYVELTLNQNDYLTTELKRISLSQLEFQLAAYPFLFRCHRAYLINIKLIKNVSGNSQGYLVSFHQTQERIPVSRTQLNKFKSLYNQD